MVRCEYTQRVKLSRDRDVEIEAVTWDATPWSGEMLFGSLKKLVPTALQGQVDEFMNAYLAANPKNKKK